MSRTEFWRRKYSPEQRATNAERTRLWRLAHPGYNARYNKANHERTITNQANYRARELGVEGEFTVDELIARFALWNDRCWICGAPATCTDHYKPLSQGGTNWAENIRPCCTHCNSVKAASWPVPYERLARRLQPELPFEVAS